MGWNRIQWASAIAGLSVFLLGVALGLVPVQADPESRGIEDRRVRNVTSEQKIIFAACGSAFAPVDTGLKACKAELKSRRLLALWEMGGGVLIAVGGFALGRSLGATGSRASPTSRI